MIGAETAYATLLGIDLVVHRMFTGYATFPVTFLLVLVPQSPWCQQTLTTQQ